MPVLPNRLFAGAAVALACLAVVLAIHRAASSSEPSEPYSRGAPPAHAASVDLEPRQLDSLHLERVARHSFPNEKQAVGSISFDEDPTIVQSESALLTAAANLELSSKELRRVQHLGEGNGIAQKELEQAIASEQSARAALKAARDALRALGKSDHAIRVSPASESVAIPANGAVREADGTTSVWVTADRHHFAQRSVKTGARDAGWVQILEGVQPGELIVTDGAVFLSNMLQAPPGD